METSRAQDSKANFKRSAEANAMRINRRVLALALLMILSAYSMLTGTHQDLKPVRVSNQSATIHFGSVMASAVTEPREAKIKTGKFRFRSKSDRPDEWPAANHAASGKY